MDECFECSGTGVAERIGGYDRPCDVCRGDGRLPPMTNPKHTDTSRSGDLVERLRGDKYTCRENMGCGTMEFCACATMEDAADRIEALTAEVERLRELLDAWLGLAREHLDTELAGRTFEALERTRK
jgi:hypothetical protein